MVDFCCDFLYAYPSCRLCNSWLGSLPDFCASLLPTFSILLSYVNVETCKRTKSCQKLSYLLAATAISPQIKIPLRGYILYTHNSNLHDCSNCDRSFLSRASRQTSSWQRQGCSPSSSPTRRNLMFEVALDQAALNIFNYFLIIALPLPIISKLGEVGSSLERKQ